MGYIRKSLLAICLILFSSVMLFYGCDKNQYKNMTLSVEGGTEVEVVLNDDAAQNLFVITAQVSKMPKGYDGAVAFSVPVNNAIRAVDTSRKVEDGRSIAVFEALQQGGPIPITITTLEGELSTTVYVKVTRPITSISFNQQIIPVIKGQTTDISKYLSFNSGSGSTNQTGVKLELSSEDNSDQLIKVTTNGSQLTVPNDANISEFQVRARSTVNNEIVSNTMATIKVITIVNVNDIVLMETNNTNDIPEDDAALEKTLSNGEYSMVLATNTAPLYSKTVYFDFAGNVNENNNYTVKVKGMQSNGSIIEDSGEENRIVEVDDDVPGKKNWFTINARGNGLTKITFVIDRTDFPGEFTQNIVLNINSQAYPTGIAVNDVITGAKLDYIQLYANYNESTTFGTPFRVTVSNETGAMINQKVIVNISSFAAANVQLYDSNKNLIQFGSELISGGQYYLRHNFAERPTEDISLNLESVTYGQVFVNVPIKIETQPIVLTTSRDTVNIDLTKNLTDIKLEVLGLPTAFNYLNLRYELIKDDVSDASKMISVSQTASQIAVTPITANIGECKVKVIAPNGSEQVYTIVLYESLNVEQTNITIAGVKIDAQETVDVYIASINVKNGLNLHVNFTINGKEYSSLAGTGLDYKATSSNSEVVQNKQVSYEFQTQNMAGTSKIRVEITGFNDSGQKQKVVYFDAIIRVSVPLSNLLTNESETPLYDQNSLALSQLEAYGKYTIYLSSSPANATFGFDDIEWVCEYNGSELYPYVEISEDGNTYIYTYTTMNFDTIRLTTTKSDFKQAVVTCEIAGASTQMITFNIVARVQQEFTNENGYIISAPKTAAVRFLVYKAVRVSDFVFENVASLGTATHPVFELTYDERDLDYDGSQYQNLKNCIKPVYFTVYPATALNKELGVTSNNSAVDVSINNVDKTITVQLLYKPTTTEPITITVYAKDDVNNGQIGIHKIIRIRVLDGNSLEAAFEIRNEDDLKKVSSKLNSYYVLAGDVALSSNWTPIGYSQYGVQQFSGYLSGKYVVKDENDTVVQTSYYSITGLRIVNNTYSYYGLFAYLGASSVVTDLSIDSVLITANITHDKNVYVGSLAGYAEGEIQNVSVNDQSGVATYTGTYYQNNEKGSIESGIYITASTNTSEHANYFVGGLVGFVNNAALYEASTTEASALAAFGDLKTNYSGAELLNTQILNSKVIAQLNVHVKTNNTSFVGGIAGFNNRAVIASNITSSLNFGSDSADVIVAVNAQLTPEQTAFNKNSAVGGVVGFNNGIVDGVTAKASLFGVYEYSGDAYNAKNFGGIVGYNTGTITNNTAYPLIQGYENIGGIVGKSVNAIVALEGSVGVEPTKTNYSFVNGKMKVGEGYFTMAHSIEFNNYAKIVITEFETKTLTHDELVGIYANQYYANAATQAAAITSATEYVDKIYNHAIPNTYTVIKITKQNMFSDVADMVVYAGRYSTFAPNSSTYYDSLTTDQIASALGSYGTNTISGNSVQFLELNDGVKLFNTALAGMNNIGGIVGEYSGLYAIDDTSVPYNVDSSVAGNVALSHITYNPIAYNSVYNYSQKTVVQTGATLENSFYGNILLSDPYVAEVKPENQNFAGGLVGKLNSGAVYANQVFAALQGNLAAIGGVVGKVEGIVNIVNSSFVGAIVNTNTGATASVDAVTGGLVANALSAATTFAYTKTSIAALTYPDTNALGLLKIKKQEYTLASVGFVDLSENYNNIAYSYFRAKTLTGYVYSYENDGSEEYLNRKSVGYVGAGRKEITIDGTPVLTDILKVNTSVVKTSSANVELFEYSYNFNGETISETNLNTFIAKTNTYRVTSSTIDNNGDGLADAHTSDGTGTLYTLTKTKFIEDYLADTVWYANYQLNLGLPVLLKQNKLSGAEDSYKISLLSNFPPTDIIVASKQNLIDTFITSLSSDIASVVYFYGLADSNYQGTTASLNFGTTEEDKIKASTSELSAQLTKLNTYSIAEILNLSTVPAFIDGNSFKLKSSNSAVLSVQFDASNNIKFVAKQAGTATITISSVYNASLSKSIFVNVANATSNLNLGYFASGEQQYINNNQTLTITKSTDDMQVTLPISSNFATSYSFTGNLYPEVQKDFELKQNINSGVRYYLASQATFDSVTYATIYHFTNDIEGLINSIQITINNTKFGYEEIGSVDDGGVVTNYYTVYIDVPYGNTANFVGLIETAQNLNLVAVPYIITNVTAQTQTKQLLAHIGAYDDVINAIELPYVDNGVDKTEKVLGLTIPQEDEVELTKTRFGIETYTYAEYVQEYLNHMANLITKFNVKVTKATWNITKSVDNISFEVKTSPNFSIEVETDKATEELFVVYYENLGSESKERIVPISTIINNMSMFGGKVQVTDITLFVNNINTTTVDDKNFIKYNFTLHVDDSLKANVQDVFNTTFRFFVAKQDANIVYDGVYVNSAISSITTSNLMVELPVTLVPQEITEIMLKHYPNSESTVVTDEHGNKITHVNLNEISYNNLVPGNAGILKAYISPYYSSFDELQIVSSYSGNSSVIFEQMLAHTKKTNAGILYDGHYTTLVTQGNQIDGGIVLQKISYIQNAGEESEVTGYDGNIYIRTMVSSFLTEADEFTLTLNAYKNGQLVKTSNIVLEVQTPPSLGLSVNGDKTAPIARGTEIEFQARLNDIDGNIDFEQSYMFRYNANGMEVRVGTINADFSIKTVGGKYKVSVRNNIASDRYIKVVGIVRKEINGEVIEHSDYITLHITDFVIDEITVENATTGNFIGLFNQPYALIVRIKKATYNPENADIVSEQIRALELEFSKYYASDTVINTWKVVNRASGSQSPERYGSLQKGYNAAKTFVIGTRVSAELNNTAVYTLQNTRFGSGDRLAAVVQYVYTDDGIKALMSSEDRANYETNAYRYEKSYEFNFGFYRVRDEERPDPIETAEQFKKIGEVGAEGGDGVDYILVNDIVLEDWEPFRDDLAINSLDGNGYVITIKNFKLDEFTTEEELISNKNIGLFGKINAGTVIKNLIIEIPGIQKSNAIEVATYEGTAVDLYVNAKAYKTVNFGILAGENAGLVTNVQVTNDAGSLREERELAIAYSDPSNPLYADYFDGVNFDKNAFIIDNWDRFHANQVYRTVSATDKTPVLDANGELIIETLAGTENRHLSVVRIDTTATTDVQEHHMAGLIGKNYDEGADKLGTITNSSVEDITINGVGNVAGFVALNNGKISSSYFKGGNIINHSTENVDKLATSGFVITNSGTNAAIQYSYVQGRLGEGTSFANPNTGLTFAGASNTDKTGLSAEAKTAFAGYTYANSSSQAGFQASVASLRALNAMIDTTTNASAFIYNNESVISNSYANIMVNSTMQSSGFVFANKKEGTITSCYTLSSVRTKNQSASPFTGRTANYEGYNNENPEGYNDCHYLKLGCDENATALEITLKEDFIDNKEPGTALGSSQFAEYNTFQGYAFNTDFEKSSEDKLLRSVWFIPNNQSEALYKEHFKNSYYIKARPELVAANIRTVSIRVWIGTDESEENSYNYVSNELVLGASIKNPILIKSAEDFNRYLNYETTAEDVDRNFAVRFISDIAFNKTDLTAQTYNMEYYGDLDGNGMTINQLRLVSDTDFENPNTGDTITHLGLFGKIKTKDPDAEIKERGVVRNLNINVAEVAGSKVAHVGALAGSIENADAFNINISGSTVIQGNNLVGGLAGIIKGDSEIVNITSSLSAKAAYFKDTNKFLGQYPNATLLPKEFGTFNLYYSELQGDEVSNYETVSYVGGIAGVFDVKEREEDEQLSPLSLFNAKARKLIVNGDITLIGEVVGGVFGLNGIESTASDLSFVVGEGKKPQLKGSRIVGGLIGENRGEIERSYIAHDTLLQEKIDTEYGNAVKSGTNPKVKNSTFNYNGLYAGNAHYTGGVVGFNNGGKLTNVYSKLNVINMNTMYAGGVVGLSIGGQYNFVYTIGSVSGFKSAGGFAGLQTTNPYTITEEDLGGGDKKLSYSLHSRYSGIYIEPNIHNGAIVSKGASKYVGIVAANIWRDEDLVTSRYEHNAEDLSIGTLIGSALDRATVTALDGGTYPNINNVVEVSDLSARMMNETVFFTQPFIVSNQHDSAYTGFDKLMPEVGSFNVKYTFNTRTRVLSKDYRFSESVNPETGKDSEAVADADKVSSTYDATHDPHVVTMNRPMGLSGYLAQPKMNSDGYYLVDGSPNTSLSSPNKNVDRTYYRYSRLQNIGSARTLKEIITSLDVIASEAYACGDKTENAGVTVLANVGSAHHAYDEDWDTIETSEIFETWNTNRWTGVRKESEADLATVLPYLEAKPEKTLIQVYNVTHLKLMSTYVNAEFQLMNDIDLLETIEGDDTTGGNWTPVGTKAIPFKGILHSNPAVNDIYTIYNLSVTAAPENYVGLVAYANEAEFKDFKLSNVMIDVNGTNSVPLFMGSVVGYAVSGTIIDNVDITNDFVSGTGSGATLSTETAGTIGGLVGYSEIGTVTNSDISSVTIEVNGFGDLSKLETERAKTLAFGGAIGYITSAVVDLPMVSNVNITSGDIFIRSTAGGSLNMLADTYFAGDANRSFDVGGVIGRSNNSESDYGRVTGITSALAITTKLNRSGNTAISSVNVGGLIGRAQNTMLTEEGYTSEDGTEVYKVRNFVDGFAGKATSILVDLTDYKESLNVGGAVGSIYGATKITLGVEYQTDDLSQIAVGKNRAFPISVTLNGGNPTTNVGGLAGLAQNVGVNNLYANASITITDKTTAECSLNAAGIIADVNNGQYIKNAWSLGSVTYNAEVKGTNIANVGGAFGNVVMANLEGTPGLIDKVIANTLVVANTSSNASNYRKVAIGGFAAKVFSGQITKSAALGNIKFTNADKNDMNFVGGFVGKLDINSEVLGDTSFPHTILISDSYATNDVQTTSMFESSNPSYAGLFIGNVEYGYKKNVKNQITLLNNYTIGKYIYTADGTFYDSLYNEKVNKGGFLGGFTYNHSGVNSTNIQRAKNLVFRNNFYNSDFVPYTNAYMEGVITQEMLFDGNSTFKQAFNDADVWVVGANKYPMLKWINDSVDSIGADGLVDLVNIGNAVVGYNVTSVQGAGSKVNPATTYASGNKAVITSAKLTDNTSLTDKTIYFSDASHGLKLNSIDERSLIYGVYTNTATDYAIGTNNGFVVGSSIVSKLANTNNGVIYRVTFNAQTGFNSSAFAVNTNNGVIDTMVAETAFASAASGSALINSNTGNVYRSLIKNKKLSFAKTNSGKIKSSYNLTAGASASQTNANYYDQMGSLYSYLIKDTADASYKFDLAEFNTNILDIAGMDFANDFIIISGSTEKLNYGAPIFRYELYGNNVVSAKGGFNFDGEIANDYYWVNSTGRTWDYIKANYNNAVVNIGTNAELAIIAYAVSVGSQTGIATENVTIDLSGNEALITNESSSDRKTDYVEITTTEYNFGVATTKVRELLDFKDQTIKLTNNIDLSSKLWTPIGFGFDNYEISYGSAYATNLSDSSHNMFKGTFDGCGYVITGATSVEVNKNVGLFGTVYANSVNNYTLANIVVRDSNFISVSNNGGFALAGAIAGRVVLDNVAGYSATNPLKVLTKVGTEHANVFATNRASGLIGDLLNVTGATGQSNPLIYLVPAVEYAYVNSNVGTSYNSGVASAFVHFGNNSKYTDGGSLDNSNMGYIKQMYISGELGDYRLNDSNQFDFVSQETELTNFTANNTAIVDKHGLFSNVKVENGKKFITLYSIGFFDDTFMVKDTYVVTAVDLATEALSNFDWGAVWTRMDGVNDNYPTLISKVRYWAEVVTAADAPALSGSTYTVSTNKQLAWVAEQVNVYDNTFTGKTIQLGADIDLNGYIWSPIGYGSTASVYRQFKGTFDFNNHTIKNMVTSGVYIKTTDLPEALKVNYTTEELTSAVVCVDETKAGLFGYTSNATITSSSGNGLIGTESSDYSFVVSKGNAGGLVALAHETSIYNVTNYARVSSTYSSTANGVAGLVGKTETSVGVNYTNLVNNANIRYNITGTGTANAGGIAGYVFTNNIGSVTITNCSNNGEVYAPNGSNVGGIVGAADYKLAVNGVGNYTANYSGTGTVKDNTSTKPDNTATITGNSNVGGIVGRIINNSNANIIESVTNAGAVEATGSGIGGVLGKGYASVYEAVNIGDIKGLDGVGGIIGHSLSGTGANASKMANILNKGSVHSYDASTKIYTHQPNGYTGFGLLIGKLAANGKESIYSAIDLSSDAETVYLTGIEAGIHDASYTSHAILSAYGIKTNQHLNKSSIYKYGDEEVKVREVFADSLVWNKVVEYADGSAAKTDIILNYKNVPSGTAPLKSGTTYQVSNLDNLKYMGDLNRKRYGVSSISGDVSIQSNITISNLQPVGGGAYPWKCDVDGGGKTLTISAINTSNKNFSLFGDVLGSNADKIDFKNLKIKFDVDMAVTDKKSGILTSTADYITATNIEFLAGKAFKSSASFGAIAYNAINSTITSCYNYNNVESSGADVGGLIGYASSCTIVSSVNKANIGSSTATNVGGLVGKSKSSTFYGNTNGESTYDTVKYGGGSDKYSLVARVSDITGMNAGGIVGYSEKDTIGRDSYIDTNNGTISANNAGGIAGCASETTIYLAENYGVIKAESSGCLAGGIAGYAYKSTVKKANNRELGEIRAAGRAGGIIGTSESTKIQECEHTGWVAATSFNQSYLAGGIAGELKGVDSTYIVSGAVKGYVGVYKETKTLSYTSKTISGKTWNLPVNYYYTHRNVDDGTNGISTYYWSDSFPSSKGVASNDLATKTYPLGYVSGASNTSSHISVDYSTTASDENKRVTLHDYYTKAVKEESGALWWYAGYVKVTCYEKTGTLGVNGGLKLSSEPTKTGAQQSSAKAYYSGFLWTTHNPVNKYPVNDLSPCYGNVTIPANSATTTYVFVFQDITTGVSFTAHSYADATTTYFEDQAISLPGATEAGYELLYWTKDSGGSESQKVTDGTIVNDTNFTFTNVGGKQTETLYAKWGREKIDINLMGKDGNYVDDGSGTDNYTIGSFQIEYGTTIPNLNNMANNLNDTQDANLNHKDGWVLDGWYAVDFETWNDMVEEADYSILDNPNEEAEFLEQYLGSQSAVEAAKKVTKGANVAGTGYENTKIKASDTFTAVTTIYAYWLEPVTITFSKNYTGASSGGTVTIAKGTKISSGQIPADPTRAGYEFTGWFKNSTASGTAVDFNTEVFNSNTTLYAGWQGKEITVSYINGTTGNTISTTVVRNGNKLTDVPTEEQLNILLAGYTFTHWEIGGTTINTSTYTLNVESGTSLSVVARFSKNSYTVKFIENLNGSTTVIQNKTVEHGAKVTSFANPTKTGYTFQGWFYDDGTPYNFNDAIIESLDIYGSWEANDITITFVENTSGTWEQFAAEVVGKFDTPINPLDPVPYIEGYRFAGYYSNEDLTASLDLASGNVKFAVDGMRIYLKFVHQVTITFKIDNVNAAGDDITYSVAIDSGTKLYDSINNAVVTSTDYIEIYNSAASNYITNVYPDFFTANSMPASTQLIWVEYNVGTSQPTDIVVDLQTTVINSDMTVMLKFLT